MGGAADLERACDLQVLGLEIDRAAGHRAEAIGAEQRRRTHHVPQALSGQPHVVERDGEAGHRRPPLPAVYARSRRREAVPTLCPPIVIVGGKLPATAVPRTTGTAVPRWPPAQAASRPQSQAS